MRTRITLVSLLLAFVVPTAASAGTWHAVQLPRHVGLSGVSCLQPNWCEAVGGWRSRAAVAHWNGRHWSVSSRLPHARGASLSAISCPTARSCVAVGELFPSEHRPVNPLIERWNGRSWHVESAPKPLPPTGYRGVNTRLYGIACPGAKLCFAVGQAVPFGAGNAPGDPLIERWDGRRWHLLTGVRDAASPLDSVSCSSTQACTAVGGFESTTGNPDANNVQAEYPTTIERWNGSRWSAGTVSGFGAGQIGGLLGVACTGSTSCLGVGNQEDPTTYANQAVAATGDGTAFSATPLAFPSSAYRGGTGNPETWLSAVACAPTDPDFCSAVGTYVATNGAIGPLGAIWNGSSWTQVALRRGPVELSSVSCPALGWCMAVGSDIAERWS